MSGSYSSLDWVLSHWAYFTIHTDWKKSGSRNTMVTSDFRPEVEIQPFRACAMHQAIIIGTVCSLWTWLWGRYHVPHVSSPGNQHAQWKICNITLTYGRIAKLFASFRKSGSRNTMVTSDFSPDVEIQPFRACAMHQVIIIGTVRSLWTWLWGRYHVPQNAFLVLGINIPNFVQFRQYQGKSGPRRTTRYFVQSTIFQFSLLWM